MRTLNKIVRKSNTLIESAHDLTKVEQKLLLLLTTYIKPNDQDFKLCKIKISDFIQLAGKTHHHYSEIETIVLSLMTKTLRIIIKDDNGNPTTINTTWLSSSRYTKGSGYIQLRFDPELKPLLLNLKGCFTSFQLRNVFLLSKASNITMYELLKQYEKIGKRTFRLEELKRILNIPKEQYKLYGHFKSKIILKAQKELKERTDICFEFEEIKEGRKVAIINFIIRKNENTVKLIDISSMRDISGKTENSTLSKLIKLLPKPYQHSSAIIELLKTYLEKKDFDYVCRNIEYSNSKSNATKLETEEHTKSNYRGYLKKTLKNDFGLAYREDQIARKEQAKLQKEKNLLKEALAIEKKKKLDTEQAELKLIEKQKELAKKHIKLLPQKQLQELETETISMMDATMQQLVINKKLGWKTNLQLKMNEVVRKRLFSD